MTKKKKIIAAVICLCILAATAGAVTAAHFLAKEKPVLPPVRENINQDIECALLIDCRLSTRITEADAVAIVEIGNWLGEGVESGTYYDAKVIKCYKGNMDSKIKIVQAGNSEETDWRYPLFTYGNKILVALTEGDETDVTKDGKEISGAYHILNSFYATIRVEEDNSGNLYFMNYYCFSGGETICPIGDTSPLEFSVAERKIRDEVKANAKENDPFLPGCQHIYSINDFEKYLETVDWSD